MAKKEIIKVPFQRERLELAMGYWGYSYKTVAELAKVSDTTIRKAAKAGLINVVYRDRIAKVLCVTEPFLAGDKSMNKIADAFKTAVDYVKSVEAANELAE